jgi:uncharacterized protein (TIGR02466 family)
MSDETAMWGRAGRLCENSPPTRTEEIVTSVRAKVLWSTPVVEMDLDDHRELNDALAELILEKEAAILAKGQPTEVAGVSEGLTAHWLQYNVLAWEEPQIARFREAVLTGIETFLSAVGDPSDPGLRISGISCWANVLRPGESLDVHHHDPAFLSAHYTVRSGNGSNGRGGETVYFRPGFMDRSHGGEASPFSSPWDNEWRLTSPPTEGRLFLFPSYVRHEVRTNLGDSERISIAMDVFVEKQNALIHFAPPRWFVPQSDGRA